MSRSMFPVGEATNNTIAGLLTAAGQGQYAELFTQAGDQGGGGERSHRPAEEAGERRPGRLPGARHVLQYSRQ